MQLKVVVFTQWFVVNAGEAHHELTMFQLVARAQDRQVQLQLFLQGAAEMIKLLVPRLKERDHAKLRLLEPGMNVLSDKAALLQYVR